MTRENKLGLIVGFAIVLLVGVLISDHFSPATDAELAVLDEREVFDTHHAIPIEIIPVESLTNPPADNPPTPEPQRRSEPLIIDFGSPDTAGDQVRDLLGIEAEVQTQPVSIGAARTDITTHVIRPGETLFELAERFYGEGERYREIYNANRDILADPGLVRAGMTLQIPNLTRSGNTGPAFAQAVDRLDERPQPIPTTYRVKSGDVLSVISQRLTGTARNTRRLYEANRDVIDNPDRLLAGTVIRIPPELALPG